MARVLLEGGENIVERTLKTGTQTRDAERTELVMLVTPNVQSW